MKSAVKNARPVTAAIIGTGNFSTAIITQSRSMPDLEVTVAADRDPQNAVNAFKEAGYTNDEIILCDSVDRARDALGKGRRAVLTDPSLIPEMPVDVVTEATGDAERGGRHARDAIAHGKHVAMVNKEADAVVGPILKKKADDAGVVYTAVDGDQHGLLMGLVREARQVGLHVVCAGKACDTGVTFDPAGPALRLRGRTQPLSPEKAALFTMLPDNAMADTLQGRKDAAGDLGRVQAHDYEEAVIMANATGLLFDCERLHCPLVRTVEIPRTLCRRDEGGLLENHGAVDLVIELRDPLAPGLGGGVFAVVSAENAYSRGILTQKGMIANTRGTAGLLYKPYHLCGVEAVRSILLAGRDRTATGADEYLPRYDLVTRARRDIAAGETVDGKDLDVLVRPAVPGEDPKPLPLRMAEGCRTAAMMEKGTILTAGHVVEPADSVLWALRREQDRVFGSRL